MAGKKIEGEYSWETLLKIKREIGAFTGELLFCYPSRIERNLAIAKTRNKENEIDTCYYIINILREEAESILIKRGYPTDLESLKSIKDYDPMTDMEADADIQIMNAKQVLISANNLKEIINTNQGHNIFIETLKLLAAAMTANAQYYAWLGIRNAAAIDKSHKKGKLPGILLAIKEIKENKPQFKNKRAAIWDYMRKLEKQGTPWSITADGTCYQITFPDKDTLIHKTSTKQGKTVEQLISKRTFLIHYF